MRLPSPSLLLLASGASAKPISTAWYPPKTSAINTLESVLNSTGTHGMIFDSSHTPDGEYGVYNWCNMPHVRPREYPRASEEYELAYVEVIQRHHKRTPYASNGFPHEPYPWNCDDEELFFYGQPKSPHHAAHVYWQGFQDGANPFNVTGWQGTCQFPQLTSGGLDDARVHGRDIWRTYGEELGFLPARYDGEKMSFRVTNNVITSQVAGMVVAGMFGGDERMSRRDVPLLIQPSEIDSLEPQYKCPSYSQIWSDMQSTTSNTTWAKHISLTKPFIHSLDAISGVSPSDSAWHTSFDHYFDNLSARLCHSKPLPCQASDSGTCISRTQADTVFRLGQFEYSYLYRDDPRSLRAATAHYGVWIAELASHIRAQIAGRDGEMVYRHNIAHDGSLAPLLSVMQVEEMVWPGMGSEVVFEVFRKRERGTGTGHPRCFWWWCRQEGRRGEGEGEEEEEEGKFFVRVLWGGKVMKSSNPDLGELDMIPAERLLEYFDGLVGENASKVPGLCQ